MLTLQYLLQISLLLKIIIINDNQRDLIAGSQTTFIHVTYYHVDEKISS